MQVEEDTVFKKLGKSQEKDPVILKLIGFYIGLFC